MITFSTIIAFLIANPAAVTMSIAAIYELIARRKPTEKDWTIIHFIKTVLDIFIKNRNANGGQH